MEQRTRVALILAALTGILALWVLRSPEKGDRRGPRPRPVPEIKASSIDALEVNNDKQDKVTLHRVAGDRWQILAPTPLGADTQAAKAVVDALERMTFGDLVTESADKHDAMGVADGKAAHVVAKDKAGKVLADLWVGKTVSSYTMVRPAGKKEVWQASGIYSSLFDRDFKGWRDHAVLEFSANEAERLSVTAPGQKLVVEKLKNPDAGTQSPTWKIVEATGGAPKTTEALDASMVTSVIGSLASLRASDFVDGKTTAELGLDAPKQTISVQVAGKTNTLLVGNTVGDDVYVKTEDAPLLFTVKKNSLEQFGHPPMDYRDKTIARVRETDLASVDITVGAESYSLTRSGANETWKMTGKVSGDAAKINALVSSFDAVVGSGFSTNRAGLDKTTGTITLHLKDKSTIRIKVGATVGEEYYVQRAGSSDILLVKKYIIDRLLKKPADLKAS